MKSPQQQQFEEHHSLLLLSLRSYRCPNANYKDDDSKMDKYVLPSRTSIGFTILFLFSLLFLVEFFFRQFLRSIQDFHPILQDETNRKIMAMHIGINAFCCFVVASLGWNARHVLRDVFFFGGDFTTKEEEKKNGIKTNTITTTTSDNRVFQYYPEGARILVFFLAFQCKNLIDSILWKDGPEYIMHHVLAIYSSAGGLLPGACHYYAIFYMGLSEASTGILCLLANFDEDGHGVMGLSDAFPTTKLVLGGIFATSFVYVRIYLWMKLTISYYFPDVRHILSRPKKSPGSLLLSNGKKIFLYFNSISLGVLTLLQIVWLFEIFRIIKKETLG